MQKKLVMVMVISSILMANIITGCGKKEVPVETQNTSVETTEAVVEPARETEETKSEAMDDYSLWTAKEWNSASDEEKGNVSKYYLVESIKSTAKAAGQEFSKEMEATITEEAITANIMVLDAAFTADQSMKLKDLLDMTTNAANGIMESVTQQTP